MFHDEIVEATTLEDVEIVRNLLCTYVQWLFDTLPNETEDLSSYYSPARLHKGIDEVPTEFVAPKGIVLMAFRDGSPAGCVLARILDPGTAEMKRLFVLPGARGKGLGRALVKALKEKMAARGHPTIRLDTAVFLTDAISLYRRLGFVEIQPYTEVPIGTAKTALFMEWRT